MLIESEGQEKEVQWTLGDSRMGEEEMKEW
jgi:hypothetical protein